MDSDKKTLDLNALDLIAIAIRDLRKISVPVELTNQIAVPIGNCISVLDYALLQIRNANKEKETSDSSIAAPMEKLVVQESEDEPKMEEVNQNGTE